MRKVESKAEEDLAKVIGHSSARRAIVANETEPGGPIRKYRMDPERERHYIIGMRGPVNGE